MKITVLGCGNAFSKKNGNQMFLCEENGDNLLIDFGFQATSTLARHEIDLNSIKNVYISHQHADHIGGLEELAFTRYDWVTKPVHSKDFKVGSAPTIYVEERLVKPLWEKSLSGGLESMSGFVATLDTYFDVQSVSCNGGFKWQGWQCNPVQQVHIMTGSEFMHSYGLMMSKDGHKTVYFTTDSQHCSPSQIEDFYQKADLIFQDCEISPFLSGVHANYIELAGFDEANRQKLSEAVKGKMWLSHYQDFYNDKQKMVIKSPTYPFYEAPEDQEPFVGFVDFDWDTQAQADGFAGFTQVGQVFEV